MSRRPAATPAELPEPPWSSAKKKRVPLSRELLTRTALQIVDAEGLEALSMRRLADELDAVPSALYAHVSGKPELIQLMLDQVAGEIEVPDAQGSHWEDQLKTAARSMQKNLAKHRDLAWANLGNLPAGHKALAVVEKLLAILRAGGMPKQISAYAIDVLPLFISASVYEGSLFVSKLEKDPKYFERMADYFRALPVERFPVSSELVEEMIAPEEAHDARFEFGLDVIVRGLSSLAKEKRHLKPKPKPKK
ncbi:MAG: TetR/AcrR family transcriptional regulator C-terminal domain-containing protein [Archangium sp.]